MGYSPWGHKELNMTEHMHTDIHTHTHTHIKNLKIEIILCVNIEAVTQLQSFNKNRANLSQIYPLFIPNIQKFQEKPEI